MSVLFRYVPVSFVNYTFRKHTDIKEEVQLLKIESCRTREKWIEARFSMMSSHILCEALKAL